MKRVPIALGVLILLLLGFLGWLLGRTAGPL
jgi:hypothetical protein